MKPLLAVCVLVGLALPLDRARGAEEVSLTSLKKAFHKAARSRDPKARARMFDLLRQSTAPGVLDLIAVGLKSVKKEEGRIHKDQAETEAAYEKSIDDLKRVQADFQSSRQTSRDLESYNKKERKISKARDSAIMRLKNLENDFTRNKALALQADIVASEILRKVEEGEKREAFLEHMKELWLESKELEDRMRYVDVLGEDNRPYSSQLLHKVLADETQPDVIRVRAMAALADREDGLVLGNALAGLELPMEKFQLIQAAIATLRRLHDKRGIEPLIGFQGREDIDSLRESAQLALVSLTGQEKGPYPGEWKKWWQENKDGFQMPKMPMASGQLKQPHKGVSFYGIHTFSDRVLFIVDISGSMDRMQRKQKEGGAGKTKMEVAKQELLGAVFNLDTGAFFNVILFNHHVLPLQQKKMLTATNKTKEALKEWVADQQPVGGTNIHDSLEAGFRVATRSTGRPILDTIFFLTDGKPTAGKIQDPEKILARVREWNQVAHMRIHAVGIGEDHDQEFMKELARIGDGRYVKR